MAQTDLLVSKGLKDAGYTYVIVDGMSLQAPTYASMPVGHYNLLLPPFPKLPYKQISYVSRVLKVLESH